jgi:hypothetical protein
MLLNIELLGGVLVTITASDSPHVSSSLGLVVDRFNQR